MPDAARKVCDFPNCSRGPPDANSQPTPYVTPTGLRTREDVNEDLKQHVDTAHLLPIRLAEAESRKLEMEARKIEAEAARNISLREPTQHVPQEVPTVPTARPFSEKRDVLPRPHIELDVSESDWSFFAAQWARYVASTNLPTTSQIHHLWAAADGPFQRALHNGGAGKITDPEALLALIKTLAVKRRNNLINIIELQRMGQQRGETISTFACRLNGQADLCDLFVTCQECQVDVSFKEKTTMYQLIRGLSDVAAQERILEAAAQVEGGELGLTRVLKLAEAFEMGKTSQELVNSAGQISRISDHQLNKRNSRNER